MGKVDCIEVVVVEFGAIGVRLSVVIILESAVGSVLRDADGKAFEASAGSAFRAVNRAANGSELGSKKGIVKGTSFGKLIGSKLGGMSIKGAVAIGSIVGGNKKLLKGGANV